MLAVVEVLFWVWIALLLLGVMILSLYATWRLLIDMIKGEFL
jgi:hypothetical protein